MTPLQGIDRDIAEMRAKWRAAVAEENREAESVALAHINRLLDLRLRVARRPAMTRQEIAEALHGS